MVGGMSEDEGDVVLVDIVFGDEIQQVRIPAELWARATRKAEANSTTVLALIEQGLFDYVFNGIVMESLGDIE